VLWKADAFYADAHPKKRKINISHLFNMCSFFIVYPNFPDVSGKLTWSHIRIAESKDAPHWSRG